MCFRSILSAGAASLALAAFPAGAAPSAGPTVSEALRQAEQAADRAVAEARAEVAAEARARADAGRGEVMPITISDVREGSPVHDTDGGVVGTIDSVDENGAVVSTGRAKARLPFSSFGRNARGLVISLSRAELEAAVAARTGS